MALSCLSLWYSSTKLYDPKGLFLNRHKEACCIKRKRQDMKQHVEQVSIYVNESIYSYRSIHIEIPVCIYADAVHNFFRRICKKLSIVVTNCASGPQVLCEAMAEGG
jgi:hypothetical protein